jgi:hypothetical protein
MHEQRAYWFSILYREAGKEASPATDELAVTMAITARDKDSAEGEAQHHCDAFYNHGGDRHEAWRLCRAGGRANHRQLQYHDHRRHDSGTQPSLLYPSTSGRWLYLPRRRRFLPPVNGRVSAPDSYERVDIGSANGGGALLVLWLALVAAM